MNYCGKCLVSGSQEVLFFIPGAWEGALCESCAKSDQATAAAFRDFYGEIKHVSDGDSGKGKAKV